MISIDTHYRFRDTHRLTVRGWKKIFHANRSQKKAGVATLKSGKTDFKIKTISNTRDKEGHYIMIKGSIKGEGVTITNIYAPNIGALQYIRQMLTVIKEELNSNTVIVRNFNTLIYTKGQIIQTEN